jgi:hypothetical protein
MMRLRKDLCLVKLAPVMSQSSVILTAPDAVMQDEGETAVGLRWQSEHPIHGKVVQIADGVRVVAVGQVVLFHPEAPAHPCDGMFPTPHVIISAQHLDAEIPRREGAV